MRFLFLEVFAVAALLLAALPSARADVKVFPTEPVPDVHPLVVQLDPPVAGYFTKEVVYNGIPIMAPAVVSDQALVEAYKRLAMELKNLPMITSNIADAGGEVQLIGKDQVTSDLPEFRDLKGKPLAEYNGLTIDQRTRGMGGLHTSAAEENLLQILPDRYHGRDILVHEFGHCIRNVGMPTNVQQMFDDQYRKSLAKGLWVGSYAGSNSNEWFSELTMWYFGTHGDMTMKGPKPADGPEGLKKYDPDAYKLFDAFYSGRIPIAKVVPGSRRRRRGGFGQTAGGNQNQGGSSAPGGAASTSSGTSSTAPAATSTTTTAPATK